MVDSGPTDDSQPVDGVLLPAASPVPTARRVRVDLLTVMDCRREMAKTYRDARSGQVSTADMSRYIYALRELARVIVDAEFDQRLTAIEERLKGNYGNPTR